MAFCTECGATIPEGAKSCESCGAAAESQSLTQPQQTATAAQPAFSQPQAAPQQVFTPPQNNAPGPQNYANPQTGDDTPPPKGSKYAVMSMGAYIGYSLLFAIPLLGWIFCLITAFASKNLNKRNYAKAILIFMLIGLVFSVILYFVLGWVTQTFIEYAAPTTGASGDFGELFDMLT